MNIHLILVDYPGASLAAVAGLQEMFSYTARLHKRNDLAPISLTTVTAQSLSGQRADAVILPPAFGNDHYLDPSQAVTDWLREQPDNCIMASACAGAFYLGAAGLLDQRRVTTHWALEKTLRDKVCRGAYVDVGEILIHGWAHHHGGWAVVMGGFGAGIDCAKLFRTKDHARGRSALSWLILGGANSVITATSARQPDHGDSPIEQAQMLIERTFAARIRISELARTVALTERHISAPI